MSYGRKVKQPKGLLLPLFFIDSGSQNAKHPFSEYYFFAGVNLFNRENIGAIVFLLRFNNLSNIRKIGVFFK